MTTESYVYFIKPIGMCGPIKIGCSHLPQSRLKSLSAWSPFPLEVVVTTPGDSSLENELHRTFSKFHTHREWFHATPELLAGMEALKRGVPVREAFTLDKTQGGIRLVAKRKWSERQHLHMKWRNIVKEAVIEACFELADRVCAPSWVDEILRDLACGRPMPAPDKIQQLENFVADPAKFCVSYDVRYPKMEAA